MSEQIKVLSEKDKARKRINVFHGSSSNWINMIKELIGNSHDVFDKKILNEIHIIIHDKNKIEYIDSAQGIPVEGIASDGSPNYKAIFEKDFAGSRYDNEKNTVGQNGIFLYTLSMTCEDIEYLIARPNGNLYNIKYHKGDRVGDLKIIGKEEKTYSKIIFSLDKEVWDNPDFTFEEISNIAQAQAALGNVKIIIEDKERDLIKEFYYPNGIESYFKESILNKSIISDNVTIQKSLEYSIEKNKIDTVNIDFIFNYSNDNKEDFQKEFLNTADLLLHGTIQDGIFNGLKNSIDKWLTKNGKYNKNEKHITLDDISTGLNYICNMSSLYVEYDNQIKQKTSVKRYKNIVKNIIEEYMEVFFIENIGMSEKICNQVLLNARVRSKAEINRRDAKKKLEQDINKSTSRPNKFVPCTSKNRHEKELILIEGDSSLNSVKLSRDKSIHSIYPLKGKPLNALKKSLDEILKNEEIMDIFQILQCGMQYKGKSIKGIKHFNINDLNVSKIIAFCDEDEDGLHIRSLLMCIFYVLAPEIITNGYFYILDSPLYKIDTKNKIYLAYSEKEKNDTIKKLNLDKIKFTESRFKGLGGLDVDLLSETAMNIENRKLTQITMNDIKKAKDTLEMFMDDDSTDRKKYIEDFGENYFDYSIYED